jgi:hypothetical protein
VSLGAISVSIRCISGSVLQALRRENAASTRFNSSPERSSATMVLSNVAGSGS